MKRILLFCLFFFSIFLTTNAQDLRDLGKALNKVNYIDLNKNEDLNLNIDDKIKRITNNLSDSNNQRYNKNTVNGELNVTLTGAATYTIPIAVAPGINNTMPQISLVYNSQSSNGIAGYGWNLSGVSSISRIGQTKYHDNRQNTVELNSNDRFSFEGQRLILKSGTYGGHGSVYQTENYTNIRVSSYGISPYGSDYGPEYFIVEYPDGSKAYYGQNTNSRSHTEWAITYWENSLGIRISYEYTLSNNILNISKIYYGSLESNIPINEIQFFYRNRIRSEQYYIGGESFVNDKILESIKVFGNGIGYINYDLEYNQSSLGYEILRTFTEKSGDNLLSSNPLVFTYDFTSYDDLFLSSTTGNLGVNNASQQNSTIITGDFTGNGLMDFIMYPTTGENKKRVLWLFNDISSNNQNNSLAYSFETSLFEEVFPVTWLGGNINSGYKLMPQQAFTVVKKDNNTGKYLFDTYSTGTTNPVYFQYNKEYTFQKFYLEYFIEPCNDGLTPFRNSSYDEENLETEIIDLEIPKVFLSGDFNGDGLTDIIAIEKKINYNYKTQCNTYELEYSGGKTFFIDLDRRKNANYVTEVGQLGGITEKSKFLISDFNGDGKSDILVIDTGKANLYTFDINNRLIILWSLYDNDISVNINSPIYLGDFNGDGKMDFAQVKGYTNTFTFYYSTGRNFVKKSKSMPFSNNQVHNYSNMYDYWDIIPSDVNNDGKTDFIQVKYRVNVQGNTQQNFNIQTKVYSNITDSFILTLDKNLLQRNEQSSALPIPVFLNSNVKNLNLELGFVYDNKIISSIYSKNFVKEKLLKTITDGNGVKESIFYKKMVDISEFYEDDISVFTPSTYTENYPNFDIQSAPNFDLVSRIEFQSDEVYKKRNFGYYGAVTNLEGLGFLGFRSRIETNWFNNTANRTSNIIKYDLDKRGVVSESYTIPNTQYHFYYNSDTNNYINKTIYNNTFEISTNKVFKIKNLKTTVYNNIDGTSDETNYVYDEYNNITQTIFKKKYGNTIQKTLISNFEIDNFVTGPIYLIGRLNRKYIEINYDAQNSTSEEIYTYNYQNLLSEIKRKGYNTPYVNEENLYDRFGNIIEKIIKPQGELPRKEKYEYDLSGRFLLKKTDKEGLVTNFSYNNSNGLIISETSPYGLTNTISYDSWFRKTEVINYLGNKEYYRYENIDHNKIKFKTYNDEGAEKFVIYDDLNRDIKLGIKNLDNSWSIVQKDFDIYNREIRISQPYNDINGSPIQFSSYKYDIYNRLIQLIEYTGKTTNITYTGLTSIADDGINIKTTVKDALGQTITLTDNGGTINYKYYPNGNLKQSGYEGNYINIEQDGWGQKIKMTDPSAGVYEYTYNGFGEIIKEKTPKGETNIEYDEFGKIIRKELVGDNTNLISFYNYDTTTKLLNTISTNNNTHYSYEYDNYKRLLKTVELTPLAHYQINHLFDSFGRIEYTFYHTVHIPTQKWSSKWIKNTYKNGKHWQIIDDATNKILWQVNTVNARGQITNNTLGNEINVTKTYDNYGYILTDKYSLIDNTNLFTISTTFDNQRGNLISRHNSLFNWEENFQYDNLDRLTHYTNINGEQVQQIYDNKGRITENNIGSFNYANNNYQNTSVSLNTDTINYYNQRGELQISYNSFKSPFEIYEENQDRINYHYNVFLGRSTMFYGGFEDNPYERKLRKHYSSIFETEIKHNTQNNEVEFITFIGGDAYNSPLVLKSNGTNQDYLYLHRDYLGSIIAISNESAHLIEKRHFDAWGQIVKVQDSEGNFISNLIVLDRGYTGHEHLQSINLIHMNGRLYDPILHRFLQPDNYVQEIDNTQNYNRYSYVLNNPLKLIDPSGENFANWWSNNWKSVVVMSATIVVGVGVTVLTAGVASPFATALILGASTGFTGSALGTALNGGSFGESMWAGATGAVLGATTSFIGAYAASLYSATGIINGALYGGSTNAVISGLADLFTGGDGVQAALYGFGFGAAGGALQGYSAAKTQGVNIFTGKPNNITTPNVSPKTITDAVDKAVDDYEKFVYRALHEQDAISLSKGNGIYAKNPEGNWTLERHLIGSRTKSWFHDPWISTTTDFEVAKAFSSGNGIIKIDLSKVPSSNIERGWLTLPRSSRGYHNSIWQQEVSIFQHIPRNAIEILR